MLLPGGKMPDGPLTDFEDSQLLPKVSAVYSYIGLLKMPNLKVTDKYNRLYCNSGNWTKYTGLRMMFSMLMWRTTVVVCDDNLPNLGPRRVNKRHQGPGKRIRLEEIYHPLLYMIICPLELWTSTGKTMKTTHGTHCSGQEQGNDYFVLDLRYLIQGENMNLLGTRNQ